DAWFRDADRAHLWVTTWLATDARRDNPLAIYRPTVARMAVNRVSSQAAVVERHLSTAAYLRGIDVSGGESGFPMADRQSTLSNQSPGTYGVTYSYGSQQTYSFLARRGVKLVRLAFRWERVQPRLGGPLAEPEVRHLRNAVAGIRAAGM